MFAMSALPPPRPPSLLCLAPLPFPRPRLSFFFFLFLFGGGGDGGGGRKQDQTHIYLVRVLGWKYCTRHKGPDTFIYSIMYQTHRSRTCVGLEVLYPS